MKRWIRRSLLGLFGASVALGGLTACGHYEREHHGWGASAQDHARHRDRMLGAVASRLDLNDDQKKKLAVLSDKLQAQHAALMGQTDPRAQVKALVAGDKFDRAAAQALVADKTAAIGAASPEVIAALGDFYDSLSPAQQAKVREAMERRHGWWHRG
jgi:Spy/CpxP family protein refolding chaperone